MDLLKKLHKIILLSILSLFVSTAFANQAFDYQGMDLTQNPANDFYQYAIGNKLQHVDLPSDKPFTGSVQDMEVNLDNRLVEILRNPKLNLNYEEELVYSLFESSLNKDLRNKESYHALDPLLNKIKIAKTKDQIVDLIVQLQTLNYLVFFGCNSGISPFSNDNIETFFIGPAGTAMDQTYYLESPEVVSELKKYYKNLYMLIGYDSKRAELATNKVIAIETKLAAMRLPHNSPLDETLSSSTWEAFVSTNPSFSFQLFGEKYKLQNQEILIFDKAYFEKLNNLWNESNVDELREYLTIRLIDQAAVYLSDNFTKAQFNFHERILEGITQQDDTEHEALKTVKQNFDMPLGRLYKEFHLNTKVISDTKQMVTAIKNQAKIKFNSLTWMSNSAKQEAIKKIDNMDSYIGFPDDNSWEDYSELELNKKSSLIRNILNINSFLNQKFIDNLGKEKLRSDWDEEILTVDGSYDVSKNTFQLSAGLLQFPAITDDPAITWGALGWFIGHEITHAFDDQGRLFDKDGKMVDWWTEQDVKNYNKHAEIIKNQFDNFTVKFSDGSEQKVNGSLTLTENIADLGGLILAFEAFQVYLKDHPLPIINGYTPEQRFFLGLAQFLMYKVSDEYLKAILSSDGHSPWDLRVNAPLSQMLYFRNAFDIPEGSSMATPIDSLDKSWMWEQKPNL